MKVIRTETRCGARAEEFSAEKQRKRGGGKEREELKDGTAQRGLLARYKRRVQGSFARGGGGCASIIKGKHIHQSVGGSFAIS